MLTTLYICLLIIVILVGLPLIVLTSIVLIEKCYSAYYSLDYTLKLRKEEDDKK